MATMVPGKAARQNIDGFKVERAAQVLPATAAQNIFTVTGRVIITNFVGEVVAATSATATNLKVDVVGTVNGLTTALVANTAVASLTAQTEFSLATVGAAATVGGVYNQNNETIMPSSTIRITTDATNAGTMRWTVLYFPLDDGASIVAL
jgi:hypothetical protein